MIYEYAVSPALFDSEARLALLYEAFGIERGRLVSDFPRKGWERLARAVIEKCASGEYERRAWKEVLIALCKRALYERQGAQWDDTMPWIDNAIREHARAGRRGFRGILWEGGARSHVNAIPLGIRMASHVHWDCPSSYYVHRNAGEILKSVVPLLDLSASLVLVDRYFHPGDGAFVNVLGAIANHVLNNGATKKIGQIKYVTSNTKISLEAMKANCESLLPGSLPKGISVKFLVLGKEVLHDRFVLTELGGIQFGQGLDEAGMGEGNGQVLVTRLSEEPYRVQRTLWSNFVKYEGKAGSIIYTVHGTK